MTCTQQTWIGAYVLDALEPEETGEVAPGTAPVVSY